MTRWIEIDKGDPRGRELDDRHYTRGSVGHPMWTRPGWNQCLYLAQKSGRSAVFVWWRPKWESGLAGTARKDGLKCIECTIFRNETRFRSSDLIRDAVACLLSWEHARDVAWPDGLITGVNTEKTASGRMPDSPAGQCFLKAGFSPFHHPGKNKRADVWLRYTDPFPRAIIPPMSIRLAEKRGVVETLDRGCL